METNKQSTLVTHALSRGYVYSPDAYAHTHTHTHTMSEEKQADTSTCAHTQIKSHVDPKRSAETVIVGGLETKMTGDKLDSPYFT